MATFAARNCTVRYDMECIPQCTTKTITEPSEEYYIFSEADSTQAFEGFKGHSESKSGYWVTEYDHPLKFDLMQKVFAAATNATPHAYLKNIMDTYFSFCTYDATSIDDSFAAMDIPAFNGQSVAYVFRFFDILKTRWWWVEKTSLIIHWDDGTTDGGKHIRFGTEPVIVPECIPQDPVDAVTIIGGYLNGTKLTSTAHATTPGSVEIVEKFPSIITQALLDTISAAGLAMWEQAQIFYTVGTGKRGLHQYGNTCTFDSGPQPKFDTGSITAYIHGTMYDLVEKTGKVTLGVYLSVPSRPRDKVQETLQLIDNVEQTVAAFNAIGSDNAQWKPCVFEIESVVGKVYGVNSRLQNVDGTDYEVFYCVPLEHTKGTLKLYISGIQVNIGGADATNYLTGTYLQSIIGTSTANAASHTTDYTSAQVMEYLFAAVDASTWNRAGLLLQAVVANAATFKLGGVKVRYYYA